ncbi:MAG: hypothetical protein F9K27_16415 [Anaerolineae bacterium]|nr:MAG: hypothetical protein F9K27_16415 [Anaerolineae bacterium]
MNRFTVWCFIAFVLLAGCDIAERRLEEPAEKTATPLPFSTATPGGRISVWLIEPTSGGTPVLERTVEGQVVGPAATATSAVATISAATQTAAAPTPQPAFLQNECPAPGGRTPPSLPATFDSFPDVIGVYLSNGGAPSVLENTLRTWSAITEQGGFVQADTDLTGDKTPEIIVNVFNPYTYNPDSVLNSGRMLVYGCDNNGYRLLYATPSNPGLALPVFHRVGDMNADIKAELVFDVQSCATTYCTREGYLLSWNPVVGTFDSLNTGQMLSINGRMGVVDIDSDGILEITLSSYPPGSAASGPTRGTVDVWDWTGSNYVLAIRVPDESRYRIHTLHDADNELLNDNLRAAIDGYEAVRDGENLFPWSVPNEAENLRAFATFRMVTAYARLGNSNRSRQFLDSLISENPEGSPGAVYAAMGRAFFDVFIAGGGSSGGCQAALGVASSRPEALSFLNSYGYANRSYTLNELCPF